MMGKPALLAAVMAAVCLLLGSCMSRPENVLSPIVETAPAASKVDMLVATTRQRADDPGTLFSGERGKAISIDNIVVSIPPDQNRKVGEVQWPRKLPGNPEKDFVTLKAERYTSGKQLTQWLDRNRGPKRRVLVFVHGFNNTYADAVYRFAQIAHDSRTEAAPVLFTWPSRANVLDYGYDKESANFSRFALEELLREAAANPDVDEVTVLAHSMGGWLTVEALRGIAMRDKRVSPKIKNVVLASPDIDVDVFRRQLVEMGPDHPHFTIIVSREDRALRLSKFISGDVDRVGAADVRPYGPMLKSLGITVIDTSNIKSRGDLLKHNTFTDSPEMVRLLGQRLAGQTLAANDTTLGDQLGITIVGAVSAVGTAADTVVSAPVAIISPTTRQRLLERFDAKGKPDDKTELGDIAY